MEKPVTVILFTNRNCLVFNEAGQQIAEAQAAISCYHVDKRKAREVAQKGGKFYLACWGDWHHEISRRSFEYLLGLRTREMDVAEIDCDQGGE